MTQKQKAIFKIKKAKNKLESCLLLLADENYLNADRDMTDARRLIRQAREAIDHKSAVQSAQAYKTKEI